MLVSYLHSPPDSSRFQLLQPCIRVESNANPKHQKKTSILMDTTLTTFSHSKFKCECIEKGCLSLFQRWTTKLKRHASTKMIINNTCTYVSWTSIESNNFVFVPCPYSAYICLPPLHSFSYFNEWTDPFFIIF